MTDRAQLAAEIFNTTLSATESLEPVATELVYLLGAILNGERFEYRAEESGEFMALLGRLFPHPLHPVWMHVEELPDDEQESKRGEVQGSR